MENEYEYSFQYPQIILTFPINDYHPISQNVSSNNSISFQRLDILPIKAIENHIEKECSICQTNFCLGEKITILTDCDHCFHYNCLKQWVKNKVNCPLCRKTIPVLER